MKGDSNDDNLCTNSCSCGNSSSGLPSPLDPLEFRKAILASRVMLIAYATAVVVLAMGVVILTIVLACLAFFYPEKANAFLLLLGGPALGLLLFHGRAAAAIQRQLETTQK